MKSGKMGKKNKDIKLMEKKIAELEELVSSLESEKDEVYTQLQRVSADYANYQKRTPKHIADSVAYEKEKFIKTILGAIDNFEHALANSDKAENIESFIKGIQIVHDEIVNTLKSLGVEQIEAAGKNFDPSKHKAMMQRSEADKAPGIVLEEFQKGYMLDDKVLRPTKVIVNAISQPEEQEQQDEAPEAESDESQQEQ